MVPGYKPTLNAYAPRYHVDSVLVNRKHVAIIANWIDRKAENDMHIATIPYKFNLLYRASGDGDIPATFHGKCDNKGSTIVIVKIANSEQIVGGYNPLDWNGNCIWKSTNDSFIFSFADRNNIQSAKIGYCNVIQVMDLHLVLVMLYIMVVMALGIIIIQVLILKLIYQVEIFMQKIMKYFRLLNVKCSIKYMYLSGFIKIFRIECNLSNK
jgi:hypothetical protein